MKLKLLPLIQARIAADKEGFTQRLLRNTLFLENGCALWTGALNGDEYPKMNFRLPVTGDGARGKHVQVYVHHLIWVMAKGEEVPDKYEVDHTCFVRFCINPTHLEAVPKPVNLGRRRHKRGKIG